MMKYIFPLIIGFSVALEAMQHNSLPVAQEKVKSSYELKLFSGPDLAHWVSFLAQQRVEQYRGYPYLYDGDVNEEIEFLTWHSTTPHAAFAFAFLDGEPVAFVLGIPFVAYGSHFTGSVELFKNHGEDADRYYYITDVIVFPKHQGQSIAPRLTALMEQHAKDCGFASSCFVSESHETHPLKTADYKDPDPIWRRLGYRKTDIVTHVSWNTKQIDGPARTQEHALPYWIKKLS